MTWSSAKTNPAIAISLFAVMFVRMIGVLTGNFLQLWILSFEDKENGPIYDDDEGD